MESVRQRQYASFEENLSLLSQADQIKLDLRTTPLALTVPLELARLVDIFAQAGVAIKVSQTGLAAATEFYELFKSRRTELQTAMERIFADKRAVMRTPEGRVLVADELWRAVDFVSESARTALTVSLQRNLKSPAQHVHTGR
jgi:hypothetical protein